MCTAVPIIYVQHDDATCIRDDVQINESKKKKNEKFRVKNHCYYYRVNGGIMCFFFLSRQFASIAHSLHPPVICVLAWLNRGPQNTFVVSLCVCVCVSCVVRQMDALTCLHELLNWNCRISIILLCEYGTNRTNVRRRRTDNSNNHTDAKVSISHFVRNSMIRLRTILFVTATQPHSIRFCRRSVRGRRGESVSIVQITMTTHHQHKAYTLYPAHHGVLFARCSDLAIYIVIFFCFLCFVAASKLSMCHHHFHHHHSHQRNCRTYFIVLYQLIIRSSNESIRLYAHTHGSRQALQIDKWTWDFWHSVGNTSTNTIKVIHYDDA